MASVITLKTKGKPNGRRAVQFRLPDSRPEERGTIRLGKISQEAAEDFARRVDELVNAKNAGQQAPRKTLDWVAELSDDLADRLAKFEVIRPRHKVESVTIAAYLDSFIASKNKVKPNTKRCYDQTRRCLVEKFGPDMPLDAITHDDAEAWRLWLADHEDLADNTVRRRCARARQFFQAAVRRKILAENPFANMEEGCGVMGNPERNYNVTREEAAAVLDACPNAEWRLIFALSRFGGLRCPSEHLGLKWGDIDWERDRFTVHSPKTERHKGKATRVVPIFPELRPYLDEAYEQAAEGAEYVIARYRRPNTNLGSQLKRFIRKAGLEPWPRIFHNLRATRETELADQYPIKVVCEWIGNSPAVAVEHYLSVTEEHFRKAAGSGCSALQKAMHQQATTGYNETQEKTENHGECGISRVSHTIGAVLP